MTQVAISTEVENLKLPALVLTAKFESEEEGSSLPKKYSLTAELRGIDRPPVSRC